MKSVLNGGRTFRDWVSEPLVQATVGGLLLTTLGMVVLLWIMPH
jgi:hypothetical protein